MGVQPSMGYRAQLVGKEFSQVFGLDYFGTYAPVARLGTLRMVYALAVLMCLPLASLDVEAAFMNAPLYEERNSCRRATCIG